jgi:hypothetical protein
MKTFPGLTGTTSTAAASSAATARPELAASSMHTAESTMPARMPGAFLCMLTHTPVSFVLARPDLSGFFHGPQSKGVRHEQTLSNPTRTAAFAHSRQSLEPPLPSDENLTAACGDLRAADTERIFEE